MPSCGVAEAAAREAACRNSSAASHVKLVSIMVIFLTSVLGISSPVLLAKSFHGKPIYDKAILIIKCFAAGVILSTSLVHVLPDAFDSLSDCSVSTLHPWKDFPFAGLVTLLGSLLALLVDLTANSSHNHTQPHSQQSHKLGMNKAMAYKMLDKQEQGGAIMMMMEESAAAAAAIREEDEEQDDSSSSSAAAAEKMRQRMVSQVLEIGIIFHSVIIGVTMGMSQNVCTIRPLVAALSFHQIFEGMGLGGCIAQAGFTLKTTAYMCFMFSVTTPVGILLGMIIFSVTGYDDTSANALILEGLLGSVSSGILIYMALVDLISADFFHNKMMDSEPNMKKGCFVALVLGSASMSILALWA